MRRLVVPAVSTAVMLVMLVSLGVWQLQRLAWKTDILARIDAAEHSPGVALGAAPPERFEKVHATGTLRPDLAVLYGVSVRDRAVPEPVSGADLLVPMERPGLKPLLVDLGWIDTSKPRPTLPSGPVTVDGFIHPEEQAHWFSPSDDRAGRHFYTLDPAAIGAVLGVPGLEPYVLVALGPEGVPDPARSLPRPPNDHLQYALTWFALAVTLVVISAVYVRKVLRHERL